MCVCGFWGDAAHGWCVKIGVGRLMAAAQPGPGHAAGASGGTDLGHKYAHYHWDHEYDYHYHVQHGYVFVTIDAVRHRCNDMTCRSIRKRFRPRPKALRLGREDLQEDEEAFLVTWNILESLEICERPWRRKKPCGCNRRSSRCRTCSRE